MEDTNFLDNKQTAFDDAFNAEKDLNKYFENNIFHIRVQQRNGRKMTTIFEGLPYIYDEKKITRAFKNKDKQDQVVITLSGDQRKGVSAFLIEEGIGKKENIITHGA